MQRLIAIASTMLLSMVMFITSIGSASAMPTVAAQSELATLVTSGVVLAASEVKRAVVLRSDESFGGQPAVLSGRQPKRKKKKKKQAAALKPLEKSIREMAKRQSKATKEYYDRHERSNRKKKNGWIRDFSKNKSKAMSKLGGSGLGLPGMNVKLFD